MKTRKRPEREELKNVSLRYLNLTSNFNSLEKRRQEMGPSRIGKKKNKKSKKKDLRVGCAKTQGFGKN